MNKVTFPKADPKCPEHGRIAKLREKARREHDLWVADHEDGGYVAARAFCPCGASSIPDHGSDPWPAHDDLRAALKAEQRQEFSQAGGA